MQMIPIHEALASALTRCHLFDQHGALVPFVFAAELTAVARVRARFGDTFAVPEFPRARIGDDFRRPRQKVPEVSAGDRVMTKALLGPDAGSPLVPDEVVREAWARTAPWMHVSLPDWWAFKVRPTSPSVTPPKHPGRVPCGRHRRLYAHFPDFRQALRGGAAGMHCDALGAAASPHATRVQRAL